MMNTNQIARIAALLGEPARTAMLLELMDGRSLTALELARAGNISAQTGSRHLAQLVESGLLCVEQHGRHRYHRLASREVATVLEGMMQLATRGTSQPQHTVVPGPRDAALRRARTCYDHIAGRLGVAIADRLLAEGAVLFDSEAGQATERCAEVLERIGIGPQAALAGTQTRRPFCRPCMDWSERRAHVAGQLGATICAHGLDVGWFRRGAGTRALDITPKGAAALRQWLGTEAWARVTG